MKLYYFLILLIFSCVNICLSTTDLIYTPNSETVNYLSSEMTFRFYSNGGVLSVIKFGVFQKLNLGFSLDIDKLIGKNDPEIRVPNINVKYRLYDGSEKLPSITIGYDGQGYNFDTSSNTYSYKEKGIFFVLSKEILFSGFIFNFGSNVNFTKENNKDKTSTFGFLGINYTIQDNEKNLCGIILEYDAITNIKEQSILNTALRFFPTSNLTVDLCFKDILSKYNLSKERILKVTYQGKF